MNISRIKTQILVLFITFIFIVGKVVIDIIILKGKAIKESNKLLTKIIIEKKKYNYIIYLNFK